MQKATEIEKHLLGKSLESFKYFAHQFKLDIGTRMDHFSKSDSINIKMIESCFDGRPSTESKKIISFLRELVR